MLTAIRKFADRSASNARVSASFSVRPDPNLAFWRGGVEDEARAKVSVSRTESPFSIMVRANSDAFGVVIKARA